MSNKEFNAYAAKCLCGCGALVFVSVDEPAYAKDNAKEIAKLIRKGFSVERISGEQVKALTFGCKNRSPKTTVQEQS